MLRSQRTNASEKQPSLIMTTVDRRILTINHKQIEKPTGSQELHRAHDFMRSSATGFLPRRCGSNYTLSPSTNKCTFSFKFNSQISILLFF
jgi:hypothetical protein